MEGLTSHMQHHGSRWSFATGRVMWRDSSVGRGSLVYADGQPYALSKDTVVGLIEAIPERYPEEWAAPGGERGSAVHPQPGRARQL